MWTQGVFFHQLDEHTRHCAFGTHISKSQTEFRAKSKLVKAHWTDKLIMRPPKQQSHFHIPACRVQGKHSGSKECSQLPQDPS